MLSKHTHFDESESAPPQNDSRDEEVDRAVNTPATHRSNYRRDHLEPNNIHINLRRSPLPDAISDHLRDVLQADSNSPTAPLGGTYGSMDELDCLSRHCTKRDVENFFNKSIFSHRYNQFFGQPVAWAYSKPLLKYSLPHGKRPIAQPRPDCIFGYSTETDLLPTELASLYLVTRELLHPDMVDFDNLTSDGLSFPFLTVEYTADADPEGGNLWTATNECAGASAACLNVIWQLNETLQKHGGAGDDNKQYTKSVEPIVYAMAISQDHVYVHVAWSSDIGPVPKYRMQRVETFSMSKESDLLDFRRCVHNILDWAKGPRQAAICEALRAIADGNKRAQSNN